MPLAGGLSTMNESGPDQRTTKGRTSLPTAGGCLDVGLLIVPPRLTLVSFEVAGPFPSSFGGCCVEGFGVVGGEDEVTLIQGPTVVAFLGRGGGPSSGVIFASFTISSARFGLLSRSRSLWLCLRYNEVRRRCFQEKKFKLYPEPLAILVFRCPLLRDESVLYFYFR